jgi:hypothetical protein
MSPSAASTGCALSLLHCKHHPDLFLGEEETPQQCAEDDSDVHVVSSRHRRENEQDRESSGSRPETTMTIRFGIA